MSTRKIRIIPRLDIKGPNLVKGIHLEGLRVLGKPENFSRYYYETGADELLYMDIVASLYERNTLHNIIERTAEEIFIPLTVGGGIRTLEDIRSVLRAGADKVSLNTAAIKNPRIIQEAAEKFGSSNIVVSIEAKKMGPLRYEAYIDNGRQATGFDVFEWTKRAVALGAGEMIITSIDQEGTGKGFDIELVREVASLIQVPVIACGGAGSVEDIKNLIEQTEIDAVALASLLHYEYVEKKRQHDEDYSEEGNIEFLKSGRSFTRIRYASIPEIKSYLAGYGIQCRSAGDGTYQEIHR